MAKNKARVEGGKKGAEIRWADRAALLIQLSAYYGKQYQEEFMEWPTKYLQFLVEWHKANKK
jgi:hypothetical protein